ncbi:ankyrin repeat-containing domain protein [Aspergillus varians]
MPPTVASGDIDLVSLLLAHGADIKFPFTAYVSRIHSRTFRDHSPHGSNGLLLVSKRHNCPPITLPLVTYFIEGSVRKFQGHYAHDLGALLAAAMHGKAQMVKFLLDHGAYVGYPSRTARIELTLMALAIRQGHEDVVRVLLEFDRVHVSDGSLEPAITEGHRNIVKMLLTKGDKSHGCPKRRDRLALRETHQDIEIVKMCLDHGFDEGKALSLAIAWNKREIVKLLLKHRGQAAVSRVCSNSAIQAVFRGGHAALFGNMRQGTMRIAGHKRRSPAEPAALARQLKICQLDEQP